MDKGRRVQPADWFSWLPHSASQIPQCLHFVGGFPAADQAAGCAGQTHMPWGALSQTRHTAHWHGGGLPVSKYRVLWAKLGSKVKTSDTDALQWSQDEAAGSGLKKFLSFFLQQCPSCLAYIYSNEISFLLKRKCLNSLEGKNPALCSIWGLVFLFVCLLNLKSSLRSHEPISWSPGG